MSFAFEEADADVMLKPPRRAVVPRDVLVDIDEERHFQEYTQIELAEAEEGELEEEAERYMTVFERISFSLYKWAVACSSGTAATFTTNRIISTNNTKGGIIYE